jgi:hypothetical protein
MATVSSAQLKLSTSVTENLTGVPAASSALLTSDQFKRSISLDPGTTPPCTLLSSYKQAIAGGGTMDVDLTAAQGSQGNVNGTGLKLRWLYISVPTTALAAVVVGAAVSNGLALGLAGALTIPIGGAVTIYFHDGLSAIDGTHKVVRFTGNAADIPSIQFGMG